MQAISYVIPVLREDTSHGKLSKDGDVKLVFTPNYAHSEKDVVRDITWEDGSHILNLDGMTFGELETY